MKITQKHYEQLTGMLDKVMAKHGISASHFVQYYSTFGLSEERAVWDILWGIPLKSRQAWFDEVYKYANDDHVTTALRKYAKGA